MSASEQSGYPPPLVDGQGLIGQRDLAAQLGVVECPQPAAEPLGHSRYAERAHGVPDPDEADGDLIVGVAGTKPRRLGAARMARVAAAAVQVIGLVDAVGVLAAQDPGVADEPDGAARGVGAATEAEEEQLVARVELVDDEAVAVADVARQAPAEPPAANAIEPAGAHAAVVERPLIHAVVVALGDGPPELGHVRRRLRVGTVPCPVAADDDALHDATTTATLSPVEGGRKRAVGHARQQPPAPVRPRPSGRGAPPLEK